MADFKALVKVSASIFSFGAKSTSICPFFFNPSHVKLCLMTMYFVLLWKTGFSTNFIDPSCLKCWKVLFLICYSFVCLPSVSSCSHKYCQIIVKLIYVIHIHCGMLSIKNEVCTVPLQDIQKNSVTLKYSRKTCLRCILKIVHYIKQSEIWVYSWGVLHFRLQ